MSDPIPSSPAESENIAVIFLGFTFATFLYGLSFFREYLMLSHSRCLIVAEMYLYFSRYPKDYTGTKVLVQFSFPICRVASDIPAFSQVFILL
jgi:hypothetical protein